VSGLGRKVFASGEILTAADLQGYAVDQSVMVFDDATDRSTAIPSPTEGMVTYRKDENAVEFFDGSAFGAVGKILQVAQAAKTDTFSTTSASFTPVTGLSVSITPRSASSKILILAQISYGLASSNGHGHFKITGGNTAGYVGDAASARVQTVFGGSSNANMSAAVMSDSVIFLDSPNSTSSVTYQLEARQAGGGFAYVNRSALDGNDAFTARGASSIIVMEVAG
jgi:hypothetical protein